jgi:protein-disulfide isomerase
MGGDMKLGDLMSGILVVCAVSSVAMLARREIRTDPPSGNLPGSFVEKLLPGWDTLIIVGHRSGAANAKVTILEFADFECPACRGFETVALPPAMARYGDSLAIVFRHWPLPYHRFAYPTARAAECAGAQGRFEQFRQGVYAKQDSLGLKSFLSFAIESGVPDTGAFLACNASNLPVPAIDRDSAVASHLGGRGTPTVVINGHLFGFVPDSARLDSLVRVAFRRGRS